MDYYSPFFEHVPLFLPQKLNSCTLGLSNEQSYYQCMEYFAISVESWSNYVKIPFFQIHLDGDSYMLRKSILSIYMEIVLKLFSGENLEETGKENR